MNTAASRREREAGNKGTRELPRRAFRLAPRAPPGFLNRPQPRSARVRGTGGPPVVVKGHRDSGRLPAAPPHSHSVKKWFSFSGLADELRCKYVAAMDFVANISSKRAYRSNTVIAGLFLFLATENIVGNPGKLSAKFREEILGLRVWLGGCGRMGSAAKSRPRAALASAHSERRRRARGVGWIRSMSDSACSRQLKIMLTQISERWPT